MLGLRYSTLYNIMSDSSPYYNTGNFNAFMAQINAFSGDPVRIATLVGQRRKNLVIAAERDAYRLGKMVSTAVQSGDTLAQSYLSAGNIAYNAGDFLSAYQDYVAAESSASSILPTPFVVSGSQGTLTPYPLQVTPISGAKSNVVITGDSSSELDFSAASTISGSVTYTTTASIGNNQVYVNGQLQLSSPSGSGLTFSISHTVGQYVSVSIK